MNTIKVVSININGLKRKLTLLKQFILTNSINILFIQEIHALDLDILTSWSQRCNFLLYHNSQTNKQVNPSHFKQGTAILINQNNTNYISIQCRNLVKNRVQILDITFPNTAFLFLNIYLPSGGSIKAIQSRYDLIQTIYSSLSENCTKDIFLLGDFNLVLSNSDRTGQFHPNSIDKILLNSLLLDFNLIDIYRKFYPYKRLYSYVKPSGSSRLDRIYVSLSQETSIKDTDYITCSFSDHCQCPFVTFQISSSVTSSIRKYHYWKLNDSILARKSTLQAIKSFILNYIANVPSSIPPILLWEKLKQN